MFIFYTYLYLNRVLKNNRTLNNIISYHNSTKFTRSLALFGTTREYLGNTSEKPIEGNEKQEH